LMMRGRAFQESIGGGHGCKYGTSCLSRKNLFNRLLEAANHFA
jgi:hypothetical protein